MGRDINGKRGGHRAQHPPARGLQSHQPTARSRYSNRPTPIHGMSKRNNPRGHQSAGAAGRAAGGILRVERVQRVAMQACFTTGQPAKLRGGALSQHDEAGRQDVLYRLFVLLINCGRQSLAARPRGESFRMHQIFDVGRHAGKDAVRIVSRHTHFIIRCDNGVDHRIRLLGSLADAFDHFFYGEASFAGCSRRSPWRPSPSGCPCHEQIFWLGGSSFDFVVQCFWQYSFL